MSAMKEYFDKTIFTNPLTEYFKWIKGKYSYQLKYWGKHLRIGYMAHVYNSNFGKNNWIGKNSAIINSSLGDFSYVGNATFVQFATIGKFCSIGPNVRIAPGKHPTSMFVSTHPSTFNNQSNLVKNYVKENKFKNYEPVEIGNDVWIGVNSVIVDGITIGNGAIVAANSVVVKNVGAYEIVGGNPAKFIKKRFDEEQIRYLQDFKWWEKDEEWIEQNISKFWCIDEFVK